MKKDIKWIIEITLIAFIITIIFSLGSQALLKDIHIVIGILVISGMVA